MKKHITWAREQFAGLDQPAQGTAYDWAYFDNAGGSFTLRSVIGRVRDYMATTPVQLGASYPLSKLAAERQAEAVSALGAFINAKESREVVLGPSSTALTWRVALALKPTLKPGDEIIVTNMDHEANRSPWLSLRDAGIVIREWKIDADRWHLPLEQLDELLNERTRLVCFSQCSNILGTIEPVKEITRRVHAAGARVFVDGVAFAPHRPVDVRDWNVDFYVFSLYKVFGPHIGLLYGRSDALLSLSSLNHEYLAAEDIPYRLQPGGANYELTWGAAAIPEHLRTFDKLCGGDGTGAMAWKAITEYEMGMMNELLDYLRQRNDVRVLGLTDATHSRLPIMSFIIENHRSRDVVAHLEKHHIAAKHGHFHSRRLLEFLNIEPADGVVRISLAHYNRAEEIARLIGALDEINQRSERMA